MMPSIVDVVLVVVGIAAAFAADGWLRAHPIGKQGAAQRAAFFAAVAVAVAAGESLRAHYVQRAAVAHVPTLDELKRSDFAAGLGNAATAARKSFSNAAAAAQTSLGDSAAAARAGFGDAAAAAEKGMTAAAAAAKAAAKRAAHA